MRKKYILIYFILLLFSCSNDNNQLSPTELDINAPREIDWPDLLPVAFSIDAVLDKYLPLLEPFADDDPQADEIYQQMMDEINNAPVNHEIEQQHVKIPGFIAPLVIKDGKISQFLLVPYFGACIHVPPPPMNQIVLVKPAIGQEIKLEHAYFPLWVTGILQVEQQDTDIGSAGYKIESALIELYEYEVLL